MGGVILFMQPVAELSCSGEGSAPAPADCFTASAEQSSGTDSLSDSDVTVDPVVESPSDQPPGGVDGKRYCSHSHNALAVTN